MRKLISIIVAFVLMNSIAVQVFAAEQPSSWAEDEVQAAIARNLVPENLQSEFTQDITRAEFAALAVALYESVKGEIAGGNLFADTNDVKVEKAAYIGIVTGVGDNKFNPNETLTREQAAVMLARLAYATGIPLPNDNPEMFADRNQVSSWAAEAVEQVWVMGIMSGVGDNMFAPLQPYTREQSVVTIMRTLELVKLAAIPAPTLPTTHTIAAGETLSSIAMVHYGNAYPETISRILEANGMSSVHALLVGQIIVIPAIPEPIEHNNANDVEFVLEHRSRRIWLDTHQNQSTHMIVQNTEELLNFTENYIIRYVFNQISDLSDYVSGITSKFDDVFFEERMLIFVYTETSTGAAIAEVDRITINEDGALRLYITTSIPGWEMGMPVTADIGNHMLIVSIPKLEVDRSIMVISSEF